MLTPHATDTIPIIKHDGNATLQLNVNSLIAAAFELANGVLEFNSLDVTTIGDFRITYGDGSSVSNMTGRSITAGGNVNLSGRSSSYLDLDKGSDWFANVTGTLEAFYADVGQANASGGSPGIAYLSKDSSNNTDWYVTPNAPLLTWTGNYDDEWEDPANWSPEYEPAAGDTVKFDATG